MAKKVDTLEKLAADLEREFKAWNTYYNYGGSDPFHEDGVNLSLIRNHIIYYKKMIEEEINNKNNQLSFEEKSFPDIYYKETPPEIDYKYMAVPNKILDAGIIFVQKLECHPTYQFVLEHVDDVFPNRKETEVSKKLEIPFIPIMQMTNYHSLVESGKLVEIRRTFYKKDFDKFINDLEITAKKIEKFLSLSPKEIEQMTVKKKKSFDETQEENILDDDGEDIPSINTMINEAEKKAPDYANKKNNNSFEYEIN